jgi:hypothetical protein
LVNVPLANLADVGGEPQHLLTLSQLFLGLASLFHIKADAGKAQRRSIGSLLNLPIDLDPVVSAVSTAARFVPLLAA